jgi:hypothetical protein
MEINRAGGGGNRAIVVGRYVVLLLSFVMATVVAHDLLYLLSQTAAALILGIPIAFLFARWVVWARSVLPQPSGRQPAASVSEEAVSG